MCIRDRYWNDISAAAPNTDFIIYNIPQLAGVALTPALLAEMQKLSLIHIYRSLSWSLAALAACSTGVPLSTMSWNMFSTTR